VPEEGWEDGVGRVLRHFTICHPNGKRERTVPLRGGREGKGPTGGSVHGTVGGESPSGKVKEEQKRQKLVKQSNLLSRV